MDMFRKGRIPDYSEVTYREAVAKLKYLLQESYSPSSISKTPSIATVFPSQEVSMGSGYMISSSKSKQLPLVQPKLAESLSVSQPPSELLNFISRQEDYIDQLEKEVQFCRDELSNMVFKVKDVVAENDKLHEQRKSHLIQSLLDPEDDETEQEDKPLVRSRSMKQLISGPNILFESRISELEAQLKQTKMELKKALDDATSLRKGGKPHSLSLEASDLGGRNIDTLRRERDDLQDTVTNLQSLVTQLRDKEASATLKAKRSLDVVDQAQFDKSQLEMEVKRLKGDLDRANEKIRESVQDAARRVQEAERRYTAQVERLNADLASQWDTNNRLSLEVDRYRRLEQELRRELSQKNSTIDELKKELSTKTSCLQSEALSVGVEKDSLEAELTAARLSVERAERAGRQEAARLQAEVASLRQRLDRADGEILLTKKENLRLSDTIASLDKELHLTKLSKDPKDTNIGKDPKTPEEISTLIKDLDNKHVKRVSELEGMIQSQTQLMEKLKDECHQLTQRVDDSSSRHKGDSDIVGKVSLDMHIEELTTNFTGMYQMFEGFKWDYLNESEKMVWLESTEESMYKV